jgi:ATP-dependent Clp protease ATP-binding subunit ClpB
LFLSILDEGQITDSRGFVVSFRNTIIVATSNLGSRFLAALPEGARAESARPQVMAEIRSHLSPELLNRFDEVVLFRRLLPEHMAPIVRREVEEVSKHLPCSLAVSPEAEASLAAASYDPSFGARPVRRTVQQRLVGPLAALLAERAAKPTDAILATLRPGEDDLEVRFEKD